MFSNQIKNLIIVVLSIALFNNTDFLPTQAISFTLASIFSLMFMSDAIINILFKKKVEVKAFNMSADDIPPHIKEKADEVARLMKEWLDENGESTQQKCNNPHCRNCHPELND